MAGSKVICNRLKLTKVSIGKSELNKGGLLAGNDVFHPNCDSHSDLNSKWLCCVEGEPRCSFLAGVLGFQVCAVTPGTCCACLLEFAHGEKAKSENEDGCRRPDRGRPARAKRGACKGPRTRPVRTTKPL